VSTSSSGWHTLRIEAGRAPGGGLHLWPRANWHESDARTVGGAQPGRLFVLAHVDYAVPFGVESDLLEPDYDRAHDE
jgi:hypothetical protein